MSDWKPDDIRKMCIAGTVCVCLVLMVVVVLFGTLYGKFSAETLGTVSKAGTAGCGLLGLGVILVLVLRSIK